MKSRLLKTMAVLMAVLMLCPPAGAYAAIAQGEKTTTAAHSTSIQIPIGDANSDFAEFCMADVADYLNAVQEGSVGDITNQRIQKFARLVSGRDVVLYLVEDIAFSVDNHIQVLPHNWTLDGRYHYIDIAQSNEAEAYAIDGVDELIQMTPVNADDIAYYAAGLVVNINRGTIKRLGLRSSVDVEAPIYLNENGAESLAFGTLCGRNEGAVSEVNIDFTTANALNIDLRNTDAKQTRFGGIIGTNVGSLANSMLSLSLGNDYIAPATSSVDQVVGTAVGAIGAEATVANVMADLELGDEYNSMTKGFCGYYDEVKADNFKGLNVSSRLSFDYDVPAGILYDGEDEKFGSYAFTEYVANAQKTDRSPLGYFTLSAGGSLALCGFAGDAGQLASDKVITAALRKPNVNICLMELGYSTQTSVEFLNMLFGAASASPSDYFGSDFSKTITLWSASAEHVDLDSRPYAGGAVFGVLPAGWTFDGKRAGGADNGFDLSVPLFDVVEQGATVKNVKLNATDSSDKFHFATRTLVPEGNTYFGILANRNAGVVENCWIMGRMKVVDNTADVATRYVGGIAGENTGSIMSSLVNAMLHYDVSVSGNELMMGGVAGSSMGKIEDVLVHQYSTLINNNGIRSRINLIEVNNTGDASAQMNGSVGYIVGNEQGQTTDTYVTASDESLFGAYVSVMKLDFANLHSETSTIINDGKKLQMYCSEDPDAIVNEAQKGYYNLSGAVFNFHNASRWTMTTEAYSYTGYSYNRTPVPNFTSLSADNVKIVDEADEVYAVLDVNSESDFDAVAEVILNASHNNGDLLNRATVEINTDLDLAAGKDASYFDEWTADTDPAEVTVLPSFGTAEYPFQGNINGNGHVITNVVGKFADGSLFGNLGSQAEGGTSSQVVGLTLEGRIFVDINRYYALGNGQKTIYIPVFAQNMNGNATAMNFAGDVWYDDSIFDFLAEEEKPEVVICLVDDTKGDESEVSNSYIYLFDEEAMNTNKACIVIKQNIGVGRGKGNKTASSKLQATDKALGLFDPNTRTNDNEEFTAEEFASGEVAYWLNYVSRGFTGEFTGMYSQSATRPVLATNVNGAVQRIDYSAEGLNAEVADYISGPEFVKVGTDASVQFSLKNPMSVSLDGQQLKVGADNSVKFSVAAAADGVSHLTASYAQTPTAVDQIDNGSVKVASVGGGIIVDGTEGQNVTVYNASGAIAKSLSAEAQSLTIALPQGFYIVAVGTEAHKVLVK